MGIQTDEPVFGLCLHNEKPWILGGLNNGTVMIYDHKKKTEVHRFEAHAGGPVRCINFHGSQELIASRGSDHTVKVWKLRSEATPMSSEIVLNLLGHTGEICSVQFHGNEPWIVSAANDCLIKIWNLQSASEICRLELNAPVNCAMFHPTEKRLISACNDGKIVVWALGEQAHGSSGPLEVLTLNTLIGHIGRVTSIDLHPKFPNVIISGGADRKIRRWSIEADTHKVMPGHGDVINRVIFLTDDKIASAAKDGNIFVWNLVTGTQKRHLLRRNYESLAYHSALNRLAAAHDSGIDFQKLLSQRPAATRVKQNIYFVDGNNVILYDIALGQKTTLFTGVSSAAKKIMFSFRSILCLSTDHCWLYSSDGSTITVNLQYEEQGSACFIEEDKVAILEGEDKLLIKNLSNHSIEKVQLPFSANGLFFAGWGFLLCRGQAMHLFNVKEQKVIAKFENSSYAKPENRYYSEVRHVEWSKTHKFVALMTKDAIVLCDGNLYPKCIEREKWGIKGAAWLKDELLFYTTRKQLMCLRTDGRKAIIKTLEDTLYIAAATKKYLVFLDGKVEGREVKLIHIDRNQIKFAGEV